MKLFLIFILFSASGWTNEKSFRDKLLAVEDISDQLKIGLNSFPGVNEDIINDYVFNNEVKTPFIVSIKYGNVVGERKNGESIKGATIYFVNPQVTTGYLWWKKVSLHYVNEPDWTLFNLDKKSLSASDVDVIKSLFNWID